MPPPAPRVQARQRDGGLSSPSRNGDRLYRLAVAAGSRRRLLDYMPRAPLHSVPRPLRHRNDLLKQTPTPREPRRVSCMPDPTASPAKRAYHFCYASSRVTRMGIRSRVCQIGPSLAGVSTRLTSSPKYYKNRNKNPPTLNRRLGAAACGRVVSPLAAQGCV